MTLYLLVGNVAVIVAHMQRIRAQVTPTHWRNLIMTRYLETMDEEIEVRIHRIEIILNKPIFDEERKLIKLSLTNLFLLGVNCGIKNSMEKQEVV